MSSRQVVKVEHKVSVAVFTSRDEKLVGEGREEDTTEERREGERERRFRLKVTGKGVGGTLVAKCNVNLMKKWSEIYSGCTRMLSTHPAPLGRGLEFDQGDGRLPQSGVL